MHTVKQTLIWIKQKKVYLHCSRTEYIFDFFTQNWEVKFGTSNFEKSCNNHTSTNLRNLFASIPKANSWVARTILNDLIYLSLSSTSLSPASSYKSLTTVNWEEQACYLNSIWLSGEKQFFAISDATKSTITISHTVSERKKKSTLWRIEERIIDEQTYRNGNGIELLHTINVFRRSETTIDVSSHKDTVTPFLCKNVWAVTQALRTTSLKSFPTHKKWHETHLTRKVCNNVRILKGTYRKELMHD